MTDFDFREAMSDLNDRRLKLIGIADDRRKNPRIRFTAPVPARIGRTDGTLIDVAARGARFRHSQALHPTADARLAFAWAETTFTAKVCVLSSRLVELDSDERIFESRIEFVEVSPDAKRILERVVETLENDQLRTWVGNLMGEAFSHVSAAGPAGGQQLLRFRLLSGQWVGRAAKNGDPQPYDGFMLPASIGNDEIKTVCAAYGQLDRDGRQLLRLFAAAAIAG